MCKNGDLQKSNITDNNILYICVAGKWRTLCPKLWGPAQATVACRQLNPERVVIGKTLLYRVTIIIIPMNDNTHMY